MLSNNLRNKSLKGLSTGNITHKVVALELIDNVDRSPSTLKLLDDTPSDARRSASNNSDPSAKLIHNSNLIYVFPHTKLLIYFAIWQ